MELTAYLTIGAVAGFAAGFLGIGGGLIIVPGLLWVFARVLPEHPYAIHMAIATSLATILLTAIGAIVTHARKRAVDWSLVARLLPTLLLGAWLGAWLAAELPGHWLARLFALYALVAGLQMGLGARPEAHAPRLPTPRLAAAGGVIGMVSSLVGIGGGSMTVPFLVWHAQPVARAIAAAAVCGYPIALAGSIGYISAGQTLDLPPNALGFIYLPALLGIGLASVPAAPLGALVMHSLPADRVRRIFAVFLLLLAGYLLVESFGG